MQPENQSLVRLQSIARFLKLSGRFYFQNYNIKLFLQFLQDDPEISVIINDLRSKHQDLQDQINSKSGDTGITRNALNEYRNEIHSFDKNVALCVLYLSWN